MSTANGAVGKHPGGRPTKLTPEVREKIVCAVRSGNYIHIAAAVAGVHRDRVNEWMKRGSREIERVAKHSRYRVQKTERPYVEFSAAMDKALAEAEAHHLGVIERASAQGQWTASAWILERRHPDRWGRRTQHEVTGQYGGPVQHELTLVEIAKAMSVEVSVDDPEDERPALPEPGDSDDSQ